MFDQDEAAISEGQGGQETEREREKLVKARVARVRGTEIGAQAVELTVLLRKLNALD